MVSKQHTLRGHTVLLAGLPEQVNPISIMSDNDSESTRTPAEGVRVQHWQRHTVSLLEYAVFHPGPSPWALAAAAGPLNAMSPGPLLLVLPSQHPSPYAMMIGS